MGNSVMEVVRSIFGLLFLFALALLLVDLATHSKGITNILNSIFGEINAGYGREAQVAGYSYNPPKHGAG